jgi:hypothetical protein
MAAFGGAMVCVRRAMGDSEQAYTGNVLCAVFLLLITHVSSYTTCAAVLSS